MVCLVDLFEILARAFPVGPKSEPQKDPDLAEIESSEDSVSALASHAGERLERGLVRDLGGTRGIRGHVLSIHDRGTWARCPRDTLSDPGASVVLPPTGPRKVGTEERPRSRGEGERRRIHS